jgi:hypothetical protein
MPSRCSVAGLIHVWFPSIVIQLGSENQWKIQWKYQECLQCNLTTYQGDGVSLLMDGEVQSNAKHVPFLNRLQHLVSKHGSLQRPLKK